MDTDRIPATHYDGDRCGEDHDMRPGDTFECGHGIGCPCTLTEAHGGAEVEVDRLQREVVALRKECNYWMKREEALQRALDATNAVYDDALDEIDRLSCERFDGGRSGGQPPTVSAPRIGSAGGRSFPTTAEGV